MEEEFHIRTPIIDTFRKSPFIGLQEHFKFVKAGTKALKNTVNYAGRKT